MAKNKVSEWDTTASNNTDIAGINIAEGCAPSGINNAIREIMAQIKDMQTGADSDGLVVGGTFTASGAVVLSGSATATISAPVVMSGTVTMNGNNNIGNTTSSTILSGTVTQTSSSRMYLDAAATTASAPPLSWSGDTNTGIYHPAADTMVLVTNGTDRLKIDSSGVVNATGNLVLGTGDATATTSGTILRAPNASGTNIVGANIEIDAGNGTGTGGSGGLIVKTAAAGSSGSTANTLTQRLYVTPNGGFSFGSTTTAYGTAGQVLKSNGDAPPSFGSNLNFGTLQNLSGTSVDFSSVIPSWAKRVTILINSAVPSANSVFAIQLITGTSTIVSTGYVGVSSAVANGSTTCVTSSTTRFSLNSTSTNGYSGIIQLLNISGNIWIHNSNSNNLGGLTFNSSGTVDAGAALTGIRITTVAGTATFNTGSANIVYE